MTTSRLATANASHPSATNALLWTLLLAFTVANVLPVFPHALPPVVYAAAQIVPAFLFALIHAARVYGVRGSVMFASISLTVGYVMEVIGVHTGFPFGSYYFTDGMGPRLLDVPILMGPAYLGMGYVSWTVARTILNGGEDWLAGSRLILVPMAASFVMVAWDLSFDPALSTFGRYWVWRQGGPYFGVPVSNFLGWYLTNYLIYQLFALYRRHTASTRGALARSAQWSALIFYTLCAAGCMLRIVTLPVPAAVADPAEHVWSVRDINGVCALAAIFIMGPFIVLACAKLAHRATHRATLHELELPGRQAASPVTRRKELERVP